MANVPSETTSRYHMWAAIIVGVAVVVMAVAFYLMTG